MYVCTICSYLYDPDTGDEKHPVPPGTRFEDLPEDWRCPRCGAQKMDFKYLK